jgi:2-methylisocitrate lyase-like PEP mutase family enzyme
MTLKYRATAFAALHRPGTPLVLANAWDVASARIIAAAGAPAIATTSAGVAWSLGYPDGDAVDVDRALDVIARIATAVAVPVTADIESGYAADAAGVGRTVTRVLEAGAVGINLEDAAPPGDDSPLRPTAEQAERIATAYAAAQAQGVGLYLNARTDVYLRSVGDPAGRLPATLERAAAYVEAGASGIFVPGITEPATVAELVNGIAAPVNILVGPGAPPVGQLAALGVARISTGSSLAAAAYAVAQRAAHELGGPGTYEALAGELAYGALNALFG